jgi:4-hydroxy 2-oxovalerate aldolase
MGRGAGNCYMESLLGFLKNPKYNLVPIMNFVQKHMNAVRAEGNVWGYDIPYLLTGVLNTHPRTAISFIDEKREDYSKFYQELLDNE